MAETTNTTLLDACRAVLAGRHYSSYPSPLFNIKDAEQLERASEWLASEVRAVLRQLTGENESAE